MKCIVTGCAGFLGSHLSDALLLAGHTVLGIDSINPYYSPTLKQANLAPLLDHQSFSFHHLDLRIDAFAPLLEDVSQIYHLAAMPGLVASWPKFDDYLSNNLVATHRLLEAMRGYDSIRLTLASTSSVYGRIATADESARCSPISPYGVTKLAAEQLALAYCASMGHDVVALRYFSLYGPRQRPDMAYHVFIRAMLEGRPITIYGDGEQSRGNTYVADAVRATIAASEAATTGNCYNIGGGESITVNEILRRLENILGTRAEVVARPSRPGDQLHTLADTTKAQRDLAYSPSTRLDDGLKDQADWLAGMLRRGLLDEQPTPTS